MINSILERYSYDIKDLLFIVESPVIAAPGVAAKDLPAHPELIKSIFKQQKSELELDEIPSDSSIQGHASDGSEDGNPFNLNNDNLSSEIQSPNRK